MLEKNETVQAATNLSKLLKNVNYKEFLCGWGSALINISITYPVNKIIFRQMLHGSTATDAAKDLYKEGFYYLYRGILPPLCQKSLSLAIMFGVYEEVRRPMVNQGYNIYFAKSIGALVSGTTEAILMPFERVQTLLSQNEYNTQFKNMWHAFQVIRVNYGFKEYYRGLVPIILRNGPSNVCFFILRDEVQSKFKTSYSYIGNTARDFVSGAMLGAIISSIFYPLNVIKVASQSQLGGRYLSVLSILVSICKERGKIRYIYAGAATNCYRAFISWGIINASYNNLQKILNFNCL